MPRWFTTLKTRLAEREFAVLFGWAVVAIGLLGFATLQEVVSRGSTQRLDEEIIINLRRADQPEVPVGPAWMQEVGRDLTAVGGVAVLMLVSCGVIGYLLLLKHYAQAGFVFVAVFGGFLLALVLKEINDRPRPNVVPHLSHIYTSSFPSGHSLMSADVYLTLGALSGRFAGRRRAKVYCVALAIVLTGLVGCSRVYMGVHYPTDVLAGWAAGGAWAVLCWLVARRLQDRGAIEGSGTT